MPSPAEVSDAIMNGLNEHCGRLDSEVFAEADGNLFVVLNYADGDRYRLRIEPEDENARERHGSRKVERRAYREGWLAFERYRLPPECNPHLAGTDAEAEWDKGYGEAEKDFTRRNP